MSPETSDRFDAEAQRIARALFLLVQRKGVSIRSLEKKMGVGDSVFNKVLKGRVTLQLRHILMIADALGVSWKQFFAVAYGLPVPETGKEEPPAPNPEDVIAEKVVQALIRRFLGTAPESPKPVPPPSAGHH